MAETHSADYDATREHVLMEDNTRGDAVGDKRCVNPKCGRPLPPVLPIAPLYPGSTGYGYLLTCCGIVCTQELLQDVAGLNLPDPDEGRAR